MHEGECVTSRSFAVVESCETAAKGNDQLIIEVLPGKLATGGFQVGSMSGTGVSTAGAKANTASHDLATNRATGKPSPTVGGETPMTGVTTSATANRRVNQFAGRQGAGSASTNRIAAHAPSSAQQRGTRVASRTQNNSYRHQVHARQATAKFKASYDNAGPAIVSVVENAAAFFEGKETPEALLDKEKSFERYQFNIDMLTEIFEGPLPCEEGGIDSKEYEGENEQNEAPSTGGRVRSVSDRASGVTRASKGRPSEELQAKVMLKIGRNMVNRSHADRMAELEELKGQYEEIQRTTVETERVSMRLFQKLDRVTTCEELQKVQEEFERANGVKFVAAPPPLAKRELDPALSLVSPSYRTRILKLSHD